MSEVCDLVLTDSDLEVTLHPILAFVENCQVAVSTDAEDPILIPV